MIFENKGHVIIKLILQVMQIFMKYLSCITRNFISRNKSLTYCLDYLKLQSEMKKMADLINEDDSKDTPSNNEVANEDSNQTEQIQTFQMSDFSKSKRYEI